MDKRSISVAKSALLTVILTFASSLAQAAKPVKICVWDIIGKSGPITDAMEEYRIAALNWGVEVTLETYTSERIATEQFRSKVCDGAFISGMRVKDFVKYTGSLNAVGAIPDNRHLKLLYQVLADPKSADKMVSGDFEVAGIAPGGAAYVFVRDRAINSIAKASGKKVAVMDYDKYQQQLVATIGATPVPVNVTTAGGKFNNGNVDVLPAPLLAYEALELYKGMEPNGGIIRFPFAQLSMQLLIWKDHFPNTFGQNSREFFYTNFERTLDGINQATSAVKDKYWVDIPDEDKQRYEMLMAETRANAVKAGYWDKDMILLQRRVRCKFDNSRAECSKPKDQL
ncbi:MAG: putative solute-binding protein [Ketobacteraceae bacterium]|nr:putative solute-binding protein [Ketobacteraceae bacterium]